MAVSSSARLTIDLDALAHNFVALRAEAGGVEVAPVLKADGYGLGAGPLARRLWIEGARRFFVARLSEGEALRKALGPDMPAAVCVLDGFGPGCGPRLAAAALTPVLHSLPQVSAARTWAGANGPLRAVLHVDTGMNRQGVTPDEARALAQSPDGLAGLEIEVVMSHLGSAPEPGDPRNRLQLDRFRAVRPLFPQARASFAASAGVFLGPDYRFDIVRPGVGLFGGGPEERPDPRLRAVATFEAPIVDIRNIAPGETVGYGSALRVDRPTRAAVVAAGYADGLIRAAKGRSHGWLDGARRRVLTVTMDLIALDIGEAQAKIGDYVELLGPNILLDELAADAGTVAHECLVRLGDRAERIYLGAV
jgi:alanine racemase